MNESTTRVIDWQTLATLPEAPQAPVEPPKADLMTSYQIFRLELGRLYGGLEGVWKGSGRPHAYFCHLTDIALLRSKTGLSQKDVGRLVALWLGRERPYTKNSVSAWEWWATHAPHMRGWSRRDKTKKYAPPSEALDAYADIVSELARLSVAGCVGARVKFVGARMRVELRLSCRECGRVFSPERDRIVNCKRCRRAK